MSRFPFPILSRKFMTLAFGVLCLVVGMFLLGSDLEDLKAWGSSGGLVQLREAEEYLRQNSKEAARQALAIFNRVLAQNFNEDLNQKAKYGMAAALERLEENSAALAYYRELRKEKIKDPQIRDKVDYALGRFYLYLNHEEEGRSLLKGLLSRTEDKQLKSKIFSTFGMFYLRRKEAKRAEENFRVALKYNPENLEAEKGRARAVKGQGRDWTAYRHYDDYLFSTQNLDPAKLQKEKKAIEQEIFDSGVLAYRKGRYHNAISFFRKLCAGSKDQVLQEEARFWIAETYKALGMNTKAIKAYGRVLHNALRHRDAAALFQKGDLLYHQGKSRHAAKIFTELMQNYPESNYIRKSKKYLEELHQELQEQRSLAPYEKTNIIREYPIYRDYQRNIPKQGKESWDGQKSLPSPFSIDRGSF